MREIRNFNEANASLKAFIPPHGSMVKSYQLDRMRELMDLLGNPQDSYKVVHVAGTSGKTSTSYFTAALLQVAGQKVGLTVSPHVSEVNERVQINLVPLPEAEYCRELSEFLNLIEPFPVKPTYFELLVAFAYWEFARQQVDYAVVEVGLGGLLDGTNVIHRADKVCVITDIGLDHVAILGHDLPSIAAQKAGIILPGNDVFVHLQPPEVMQVFQETATKQQARLHEIAEDTLAGSDLPAFQQRNWTLAKAAYDFVAQRDDLQTSAQAIDATQHTLVPARMETLRYQGKTIVLDGAHNAQKMSALVAAMRARFGEEEVAVLMGMVEDKREQLEGAMAELSSIADAVIATTFQLGQDVPRKGLAPEDIAEMARQAGIADVSSEPAPDQALQRLLARPEKVLLVTGSFYLVSALRGKVQELASD